MKIGIDVSRLYTAQTGVSVYTRHISEFLLKHEEHQIALLRQPSPKFQPGGGAGKILKHLRHINWTQLQLPALALAKNCEALLCPEVASPVLHLPNLRTVATVHDTIVRLYPEGFDSRWRKLYHLFDENSLRFAHRVICDSYSTRTDLLRFLPHLMPEKVRVVHLAAGPHFQPLAPDAALRDELRQKYDLTYKQYLLYVGARNVRKNLPRLVQAFARVALDYPEYKLVLNGPGGGSKAADATEAIKAAVAENQLENRVLLLENTDDEALVKLYNGATALVFPSLYEGFGLPPLEALNCGTPVICSRVSSLPEVAGDAALYIENPEDMDEIAARIKTLLANPDLADTLREKGFVQAKNFSWEKTARQTLEILMEK